MLCRQKHLTSPFVILYRCKHIQLCRYITEINPLLRRPQLKHIHSHCILLFLNKATDLTNCCGWDLCNCHLSGLTIYPDDTTSDSGSVRYVRLLGVPSNHQGWCIHPGDMRVSPTPSYHQGWCIHHGDTRVSWVSDTPVSPMFTKLTLM